MIYAVAIPANDRPRLLEKALTAFHSAIGSANWVPFITEELSPRRGCRVNTHTACQAAIDGGAHWILYLEDDVLLSPDAIMLCENFADSSLDGIVCLRRWHDTQDLSQPVLVRPAQHGLLGDGFFFPSTLWPFLSSWWFRDEPDMGGKMWDWSVSYGLDKAGILQWRPLINRSRNIGVHGTHCTSASDQNRFGPAYEGPPITQFIFMP